MFEKRSILLDCNFLIAWVSDTTSDEDRVKITFFLNSAESNQQRLIIPTPALAEFLVKADDAGVAALSLLDKSKAVKIGVFDKLAAYECAALDRSALSEGNKKGGIDAAWQKIKFDRQIIAIGKVHNAGTVVTSDAKLGEAAGKFADMRVLAISDLPLPPAQILMPLE
jgi:predicted nucleic acid-binding protein